MSTPKVRMLIVDDQGSIRSFLKATLLQMGADVVGEAADGEEAVRQYSALQPHITLMDINMPRMDGVDALQKIIQINPQALVIMMTSQNDAEVISQCLDIGARNFLLKENTPEEIQQEIRNTWKDYLQKIGKVS